MPDEAIETPQPEVTDQQIGSALKQGKGFGETRPRGSTTPIAEVASRQETITAKTAAKPPQKFETTAPTKWHKNLSPELIVLWEKTSSYFGAREELAAALSEDPYFQQSSKKLASSIREALDRLGEKTQVLKQTPRLLQLAVMTTLYEAAAKEVGIPSGPQVKTETPRVEFPVFTTQQQLQFLLGTLRADLLPPRQAPRPGGDVSTVPESAPQPPASPVPSAAPPIPETPSTTAVPPSPEPPAATSPTPTTPPATPKP